MAKQPLKKEELQEAFTMNCSSDSTIPLNKLGTVIRSIGRAPTESQLRTLVGEFQNKGVKGLTYPQVEAIVLKYDFAPEDVDTIKEAFRIFDKDGNGLVNSSELRHILCTLGEKLTDEEVDEMLREADVAGNGQVIIDDVSKLLVEAGN